MKTKCDSKKQAWKTEITLSLIGALFLGSLYSCAPGNSQDTGINQIAENDQQSQIIGGTNADSTYQKKNGIVGLLMVMQDLRSGMQMNSICTGSLIAKNTVLTAAHCLFVRPGTKLIAALVFFDTNLQKVMSEISKNELKNVRSIDKVIRHESYLAGRGTNNDIGVIHFNGTHPDGFQIAQRAPAQWARTVRKGSTVTLAGFGVSNYKMDPVTGQPSGSGSGLLRQISGIRILNLTPTGEEITLDQTQGRGACHGDSGGPAYQFDSLTKKSYLIGVTSRGTQPDGLCDREAIYTGVAGYSAWIDTQLKKLNSNP